MEAGMSLNRYFKCNILGGFRLTDIGKNVKAEEVFLVDSFKANSSNALKAALKGKWVIELTAKEASSTIDVPVLDLEKKIETSVLKEEEKAKEAYNDTKVILPDFKAVEEHNKKKEEETRNLTGTKDNVAIPDLGEVNKKISARRNDTINKGRDEIIKNGNIKKQEIVKKSLTDEETQKLETPPVSISLAKEESITEEIADNSQLSVPSQLEQTTKEEPVMRRRRRTVE
jgi:hypothetical protein